MSMFDPNKLCLKCGEKSHGRYRGSVFGTLILLCFYILPGILYELWRMAPGKTICPTCRQPGIVPISSPAAIRYLDHG